MIKKLHLKLLGLYALVLLIVSAIIFISGYKVYQKVSRDMLQDSLRSYLQEEIYEFKKEGLLSKIELHKIKTDNLSLQFFSFHYSSNYLLKADVPEGEIGEVLSEKINAIKDYADDFKEVKIYEKNGKRWDFLVLSRSWADVLGFQKQVAVALNISPNVYMIHRYKSYGLAGVLLLCLLSILLAYKMADSAVKPLVIAYDKQKKFASDVSHEMKTPLSVLLTYTEILEKKPDKNIITILKSEIKNMSALVDNLLTLTRLDQKKQKIKYEKIKTDNIIENVVNRLNMVHTERMIPIKTALSPCYVMMDAQHFERLVTIFLDNALKYTPTEKSILIFSTVENGKFILKIKDEGIGIPFKEQSHIFERFYRVDQARNRQNGGNGLGLSLAKELVDYYKGKIEVISKPKQGSEFIITLPKA